jgi:hypothetical protein
MSSFLGRNDLKGNFLYHDLKNYIRKFEAIEKKLGDQFTQLFKVHYLPEGHILLNRGQVSKKIYFLIKGSANLSTYDDDGNEVLLYFFKPGEFIDWYASAKTKLPSHYVIYLNKDATLLSAYWDDIKKLADKHTEIYQLEQQIVGDFLAKFMAFFCCLLTCNAAGKYQYLVQNDPYALQNIQGNLLCTLMGMERETLSRVSHSKRR